MSIRRLTQSVKRALPSIRLETLSHLMTLASGLVSILATMVVLRGHL